MVINTKSFELEVSRAGAFLRVGRREFWLAAEANPAPGPLVEWVNEGPQGSRLFVGRWRLVAS